MKRYTFVNKDGKCEIMVSENTVRYKKHEFDLRCKGYRVYLTLREETYREHQRNGVQKFFKSYARKFPLEMIQLIKREMFEK